MKGTACLRRVPIAMLLVAVVAAGASAAGAQTLGTFRWQTAPFCNVVTLTVTQTGGVFTLDGFDQPCDGAPRQPVHGIATPQPNGAITLGLSVVLPAGAPPVNIEGTIDLATLGGTWRDSARNSGTLAFNPTSTSGGPRVGPIVAAGIPPTFSLSPNGNFVAVRGPETDALPVSGTNSRLVWHAGRSAFRAGRAFGTNWDVPSLGEGSAAFGFRPVATGQMSFAAGIDVQAHRFHSIALGSAAIAETAASFVFGDRSTATPMTTDKDGQFKVRAAGGFGFYTNAGLTMGVELLPNSGQFSHLSDVNAKEHFRDLDEQDLLAKIARMPVREWSYKTQRPGIRHAGPTAQDFHAAFGLGEDSLRIGMLDADGINLAAAKALEARTRAMGARKAALDAQIAALRMELAALREIRR